MLESAFSCHLSTQVFGPLAGESAFSFRLRTEVSDPLAGESVYSSRLSTEVSGPLAGESAFPLDCVRKYLVRLLERVFFRFGGRGVEFRFIAGGCFPPDS